MKKPRKGQVYNAPNNVAAEVYAQFSSILGETGSADVLLPGTWVVGNASAEEPARPLTLMGYFQAICPEFVACLSIASGSAEIGVLAEQLAALRQHILPTEGVGGLDRFMTLNRFVVGATEREGLSNDVVERFSNLCRYRLLTSQLEQPGLDDAYNRWSDRKNYLRCFQMFLAVAGVLSFAAYCFVRGFTEHRPNQLVIFGACAVGMAGLCVAARYGVQKSCLGKGRPSDGLTRQRAALPAGTAEGIVPLMMAEGERLSVQVAIGIMAEGEALPSAVQGVVPVPGGGRLFPIVSLLLMLG